MYEKTSPDVRIPRARASVTESTKNRDFRPSRHRIDEKAGLSTHPSPDVRIPRAAKSVPTSDILCLSLSVTRSRPRIQEPSPDVRKLRLGCETAGTRGETSPNVRKVVEPCRSRHQKYEISRDVAIVTRCTKSSVTECTKIGRHQMYEFCSGGASPSARGQSELSCPREPLEGFGCSGAHLRVLTVSDGRCRPLSGFTADPDQPGFIFLILSALKIAKVQNRSLCVVRSPT